MDCDVSPVPLSMPVRARALPPPLPVVQAEKNSVPDLVLEAINRLNFVVPAPIIEPPDLSDVVNAVLGLKPGPTAAEIAQALADVLQPVAGGDDGAPLREVAEALRTLDFRLQGMGRQAYGGGAVHLEPSDVTALRGLTNTELRASAIPVSGTLTTTTAAPTTVRQGQKLVAVTNTAVVLSTSASVFGVIIQGLAANAGNVYVGGSGVTTANGYELQPGQATSIAIDDLSKMFVNGTAGDGVCFMGS